MKLTTIIPVNNGIPFLSQTMHNVLVQTRAADEVIVLDNASTDDTARIAAYHCLEYGGCMEQGTSTNWRVVTNESNLGLVGNFNKAVQSYWQNTDLLHLLMADDLIDADFYARAVEALAGVDGPAMAYAHYVDIDESEAVIGKEPATSGKVRKVSKERFIERHAELNPVALQAIVFKTNREPPPCFFRSFPQVQDIVFIAELAQHMKGVLEIDKVMCRHRMHQANATSRNVKNVDSWVRDEWQAMSLIHSTMLRGGPMRKRIREQKLKCIFAARSFDKTQIARRAGNSEYARKIESTAREKISSFHWLIGRAAVAARDTIKRFGKHTPGIHSSRERAAATLFPRARVEARV